MDNWKGCEEIISLLIFYYLVQLLTKTSLMLLIHIVYIYCCYIYCFEN